MTMHRHFLAALAFGLGLSVADAHETWLVPDMPLPVEAGALDWSLASGMRFGAEGTGIAPERIRRARVHSQGDDTAAMDVTDAQEKVTRLNAELAPGVNCAEVVLKPRFLTLDPDKIDLYFDEIGASEAMREAWQASPTPELWRETYTKYAKAIVRVGEPAGSQPKDVACWQTSLGHALEFVPERDPTMLKAGATLTIRVLVDGAPASGQVVGLAHEDGDYAPLVQADASGQVTFELAEPGMYMVYGTRLVRSDEQGEDWTSDFATLVFGVADKR